MNEGVMIVDAGGGTIDISTYCRSHLATSLGQAFEEIAAPSCKLHVSNFSQHC
jgi:hypothetical protein